MNHKESFEQDGFVAMPGFYDAHQLQDIEAAFERFVAERVTALPPEHVFYEDKANRTTLKQIQRMHEHDDFFEDLLNGKLKLLAEELLKEPVLPKNLQFFNKPPGIGKATPPHQDGYYFMIEPCQALTLWLALDNVDEENGCVRYIRGSHMRGMRPHARTQTLGFSQGISDYVSDADEAACLARPGDLLAHHALTIHRADANNSVNRSRRALGFVFYGISAKEDKPAHEAYQRKLKMELVETGKI